MEKTLVEGMGSPITGGRVFLVKDIEKRRYKGREYDVHVEYYVCEDTGEEMTSEEQDQKWWDELMTLAKERNEDEDRH